MTVFADALYWIAVANPRDPWSEPARRARHAIRTARIVTTDEVLSEFLTAMASGGSYLRQRAADVVRSVLTDPMVTVVQQSRASFLAGLAHYESRPDKSYSMVDCVSMNTMREEAIHRVLTNDHHFAQEGFTVLIER